MFHWEVLEAVAARCPSLWVARAPPSGRSSRRRLGVYSKHRGGFLLGFWGASPSKTDAFRGFAQ